MHVSRDDRLKCGRIISHFGLIDVRDAHIVAPSFDLARIILYEVAKYPVVPNNAARPEAGRFRCRLHDVVKAKAIGATCRPSANYSSIQFGFDANLSTRSLPLSRSTRAQSILADERDSLVRERRSIRQRRFFLCDVCYCLIKQEDAL